ncbi:thioesterase family protein isoform 2 [Zea mays]|uniref:thioesterase family protein isoform 2 n=1 Tax=Zea mays TaxID=4577 RepID=UPI0004DEBEED|nr:thioesterase family protein isoform 2 [Zea mays]|eukprot:XP_008672813.1 thioesterase family protein isoform X1 [Zea mays]
MGDGETRLVAAATARKWLEDPRVGYDGGVGSQALSCVAIAGARVSVAERGRVVCSLRVRAPVADAEGRWHAGAIAAAVDCVCSAVAYTVEAAPTATVHYSLSYFSPADRDARARTRSLGPAGIRIRRGYERCRGIVWILHWGTHRIVGR